MNGLSFAANGLAKVFNRRTIFSGLGFTLTTGDSLAVTGKNGSGKSTLVKILSHVLSPTRGEVALDIDGRAIPPADRYLHLGMVSPYLQLYDEFSGLENLQIFRSLRGTPATDGNLLDLLARVNIAERKDDPVRTYSSGMKQRLKYAFALMHHPAVLLLDEPTSNLDAEGIATVYQIIAEQKQKGILILATNDREDLRHCERSIDLDHLPPGPKTS